MERDIKTQKTKGKSIYFRFFPPKCAFSPMDESQIDDSRPGRCLIFLMDQQQRPQEEAQLEEEQ